MAPPLSEAPKRAEPVWLCLKKSGRQKPAHIEQVKGAGIDRRNIPIVLGQAEELQWIIAIDRFDVKRRETHQKRATQVGAAQTPLPYPLSTNRL